MNSPLRILYLEDSLADVELVTETLERQGLKCAIDRVESGSEFAKAFQETTYDLILSDFSLPSYNGLKALKHVRERDVNVPFILISGMIGEDPAIQSLLDGATDYVLKNKMSRLVPAVQRALRETESRREREHVNEELRKSERRLKEAQAVGQIGSWDVDVRTGEVFWSEEALKILGVCSGAKPLTLDEMLNIVPSEDRDLVRSVQTRGMTEQRAVEIEHRIMLSDGSVRWLSARIDPSFENNVLSHVRGVIQDITRRKTAEEALVYEQSLLRALMDNIPDHVYFKDRESRFLRISKAQADHFGLDDPAQAIGKTDFDFFAEAHARPAFEDEQSIIRTGIPLVGVEEQEVWPDGREGWVSTTKVPLKDAQGRIIGTLGVSRDITRRKRIESALRDSKLMLQTVLDSIPAAVFWKNLDLVYLGGNRSWLHDVGLASSEEVMGKTDYDLPWGKKQAEAFREYDRQIITTGVPEYNIVEPYTKADGSEAWARTTKIPLRDADDRVVGILGTYEDITDRKRAEEELRKSELQYKNIVDFAPVGIFQATRQVKILFANQRLAEILGYESGAELIGRDFFKDLPLALSNRLGLERSADPHQTAEFELQWKKKDGSPVWVQISSHLVKEPGSGLEYYEGFVRDITQQKWDEDELRRNRELLTSILEGSRDGIVLEDDRGMIEFVNGAYVQLFGYDSASELIGRHESIALSERDQEKLRQYGEKRLRGEDAPTLYEYRGKRKDGSLIDLEVSVTVADIGGKKHILCVIRDIQERKKAEKDRRRYEDEIRQAQKMESLGTLAGGIAHDFNNILGIILGHLSILQHHEYDASMRERSADTIGIAVQRGANLVRQILTFARKSEVTLGPVSVNESVKEIRKMLTETFPRSIEFHFELEKALPLVIMDSNQLHQALLNLCVNARDAVLEAQQTGQTEPASIAIETKLLPGTTVRAKFHDAAEEQYIAVSVKDNGPGMTDEVKAKIFEPFFTTKEKGKGTGMGLAVVYGVAQSAHGFLDVESRPGHGSVFTIYLPVPKDMMLMPIQQETEEPETPGGTETILLVEDEETMLSFLQVMLSDRGYSVLSARDGAEALECFKRDSDRIRLVITDLGLPKMSGEQLLRALKNLKPDVPVLIASGYIEPEQKAKLFEGGAADILLKPYEISSALKKVRKVLDAR